MKFIADTLEILNLTFNIKYVKMQSSDQLRLCRGLCMQSSRKVLAHRLNRLAAFVYKNNNRTYVRICQSLFQNICLISVRTIFIIHFLKSNFQDLFF